LRRGNTLDALAAAARIHATGVQPNMRDGCWPQAQACCELVLSCLPARPSPGYLPRLRGVFEFLHADAARAAREGGDLRSAKSHLHALLESLRERRAPAARQVIALVDLAYIHIDSDDARTGRRMLAGLGPFLASAAARTGGDLDAEPDLWEQWPRLSVPAQRKPVD
jgi:hypothetical protein